MTAITKNAKIIFFMIQFVCVYMMYAKIDFSITYNTLLSVFRYFINIVFLIAFFPMFKRWVVFSIQSFRFFLSCFRFFFNKRMSWFKSCFEYLLFIFDKVSFTRTIMTAVFSRAISIVFSSTANIKFFITKQACFLINNRLHVVESTTMCGIWEYLFLEERRRLHGRLAVCNSPLQRGNI